MSCAPNPDHIRTPSRCDGVSFSGWGWRPLLPGPRQNLLITVNCKSAFSACWLYSQYLVWSWNTADWNGHSDSWHKSRTGPLIVKRVLVGALASKIQLLLIKNWPSKTWTRRGDYYWEKKFWQQTWFLPSCLRKFLNSDIPDYKKSATN